MLSHKIKGCTIAVAVSVPAAVIVSLIVYYSGFYMQGDGIYAQLYKLDVIADYMREGVWYPLFAERWYNGYEIFRYTPPTCYLLIYVLTTLFRVDIHVGISLFYGILAFLSYMGFFMFGIRRHRMTAAFLTGTAFLLLPSTIEIAAFQASFGILLGLALLPLLIFFLFDFVEWQNRLALLPYTGMICLLVLSDYVLAIAVGAVLIVYLVLHVLTVRSWRFEITILADTCLTYLTMAICLYPALSGGMLTIEHSLRGNRGLSVGGAMIGVSLLGLAVSDRSRAAGFLLAAAGSLLSLDAVSPVLRLVPFPVLQGAYWYLIPVTVFCLVMLLYWKRLRFVWLAVLLGVCVAGSIPEIARMQDGSGQVKEDEAKIKTYLLQEAAEAADNRVALLDNTALGDFPHWYFAAQGVDSMFGWDFENALTVRNQMCVNEALADGFYDYMFNRLLLYGNDVVLLLKETTPGEDDYEAMLLAAQRRGYYVRKENAKAVVLKSGAVDGRYGVISEYEDLAIGKNASYIAYIYPSFGLGRSDCLEDYTLEELSRYRKLYLSGFSYEDKEKAETLLAELSDRGVEIYIDMQYIPENRLTGKNEFMDVYAQFVQFTEVFPVLQNENGNQFKLDFKTKDYELWNTVYLSGCSTVLKETAYEKNRHLVYLGRGEKENITFMGLNLVYYYLTTHNRDLKRFLDEAMQLTSTELPGAEIVPVEIERKPSELLVRTQRDGVNSGIAALETLVPDRMVTAQESLWVVNHGETVFRMEYPGYGIGVFLSIVGLIGLGLLWITTYVVLDHKVVETR